MVRTRIPAEEDFTPLTTSSQDGSSQLQLKLVYPSPRESTTAIMILFHGLGDNEDSFAALARNLNLPGVLNISVRGVNPLPTGLFSDELIFGGGGSGDGGTTTSRHFHWGDDLRMDSGDLDLDPGFEKARRLIMERLVGEVLVGKCGWEVGDILLFGFGQGGALALGLASSLRRNNGNGGARVQEVTEEEDDEEKEKKKETAFKGVVSIGGPLPASMVPTVSTERAKAKTPVLICHGRESEAVDEDAVDFIRQEFEDVRVVEWKRSGDGMPRNREEVLPMMQFFAERLRNGW